MSFANNPVFGVCRFPQLQFEYKDPEKNFNRKSVHGIVARLLRVKDVSTATALEVTAGGKVRFGVDIITVFSMWVKGGVRMLPSFLSERKFVLKFLENIF